MKAVIYARYSSQQQRESSIQDQYRNCEKRAESEGLHIIKCYADEAISGSRKDRPEYQQMLSDANNKLFDILLVDDLSRLSRDMVESEQTIRRLEFHGIRIVGVSDGYDSRNFQTRKLQRSVKNLINDVFLDDLKEKTHRGLMGQALKKNNAGGKTYGYRHVPIEHPTKIDKHGRPLIEAVRREIDIEQATVVKNIFSWYANGRSPMWIANELNEQSTPSPRGGQWAKSAIYPDRKRSGVGMLSNPLYIGRYIWNRSKWEKNPDTGKRRRVERPESDWITQEMPELRIIDQHLWDKVQARLDARRCDAISLALKNGETTRGRPGHLFSGILKCGSCGGSYVMVNQTRYGCGRRRNYGQHVCDNSVTVKRSVVEERLLAGIKHDLLKEEQWSLMKNNLKKIYADLKQHRPEDHIKKRLEQLNVEIHNMVKAIKNGAYSDALQSALEQAESENERLQFEMKSVSTVSLTNSLPKLLTDLRNMIERLGELSSTAPEHIGEAKERIKNIVGGKIILHPMKNKGLEAEIVINLGERVRLAANEDGWSKSLPNVVAGAGFEPTTFGL